MTFIKLKVLVACEESQAVCKGSNPIQVFKGCTPHDQPELENHAIFVTNRYDVEIGNTGVCGTYIAFKERY